MRKIHFLSYITKITGKKEIEIPSEIKNIRDLIQYLQSEFDKMDSEFIHEHMLIMGEKVLVLPRDLNFDIVDDIYISPIIAGG